MIKSRGEATNQRHATTPRLLASLADADGGHSRPTLQHRPGAGRPAGPFGGPTIS